MVIRRRAVAAGGSLAFGPHRPLRPDPLPREGSVPPEAVRFVSESYATYQEGVHALREAGLAPPTFAQNLRARLGDPGLFDTSLDSCSAVIHSGGSRIKIDLRCGPLLELHRRYGRPALLVDYDAAAGVELDRSRASFNRLLSREEFLAHPAWHVLFGGSLHPEGGRADDREATAMMQRYADEYFGSRGHRQGLSFNLPGEAPRGTLNPLGLGYGYAASSAYPVPLGTPARFALPDQGLA